MCPPRSRARLLRRVEERDTHLRVHLRKRVLAIADSGNRRFRSCGRAQSSRGARRGPKCPAVSIRCDASRLLRQGGPRRLPPEEALVATPISTKQRPPGLPGGLVFIEGRNYIIPPIPPPSAAASSFGLSATIAMVVSMREATDDISRNQVANRAQRGAPPDAAVRAAAPRERARSSASGWRARPPSRVARTPRQRGPTANLRNHGAVRPSCAGVLRPWRSLGARGLAATWEPERSTDKRRTGPRRHAKHSALTNKRPEPPCKPGSVPRE